MNDGIIFILCLVAVAALPAALLVALICWLNRH